MNLSVVPSQILNEQTVAHGGRDFSCVYFPNEKSCQDRIRYSQSKLFKETEPKTFEEVQLPRGFNVNGETFLILKRNSMKLTFLSFK